MGEKQRRGAVVMREREELREGSGAPEPGSGPAQGAAARKGGSGQRSSGSGRASIRAGFWQVG